jgi:hypothetical protein
VTFTCNPKWPEIQNALNKNFAETVEDRPDIVCKVFKCKFDILMKMLTEKHILGLCIAYMYAIEFQKRQYPHGHITLILDIADHPRSGEDFDKIAQAVIPNKETDPQLYKAFSNFMMHSPCEQLALPCWDKEQLCCSKHFPFAFVDVTAINDLMGRIEWHCPNDGHYIEK